MLTIILQILAYTGNGLGISVGNYDTFGPFILEAFHDLDGRHVFDVLQLSSNEVRIYDTFQQNVSYLLGWLSER